jgi:hypothetical protein
MGNESLFFGNLLQGFAVGQQMARNRKSDEEERKLKTKLYEIQLRRETEAAQKAAEQTQQETDKRRLSGINRDMIMGEAELGVKTGQHKTLADALADLRLQSDMRRYGFDPAKDFGVQDEPADIRTLRILGADPELAALDRSQRSASSPSTTINTGESQFGKIEQGYVYERDPETGQVIARPVPGSGAEFERTGAETQIDSSYRNSVANLDRLIEKAEALRTNPNLWMGVGIGGMTAGVPGSPGANVQADIESLTSQVAFGVLQAMREASKTGGALGAVSERELGLLENNLAALSKAQSPGQYQQRLMDIVRWAQQAAGNLKTAYDQQRKKGGLGATPPAMGPRKPINIVDFADLSE